MPIKCYRKPNRSKPRLFHTCDAVRICDEILVNDDLTPEQLFACLLKHFGFTHISLSRRTVVQSGGMLVVTIRALELVVKAIEAIQKILARFPRAVKIVELLLGVKKAIDEIERIFGDQPDQALVEDILVKDKCNCKRKLTSSNLRLTKQ